MTEFPGKIRISSGSDTVCNCRHIYVSIRTIILKVIQSVDHRNTRTYIPFCTQHSRWWPCARITIIRAPVHEEIGRSPKQFIYRIWFDGARCVQYRGHFWAYSRYATIVRSLRSYRAARDPFERCCNWLLSWQRGYRKTYLRDHQRRIRRFDESSSNLSTVSRQWCRYCYVWTRHDLILYVEQRIKPEITKPFIANCRNLWSVADYADNVSELDILCELNQHFQFDSFVIAQNTYFERLRDSRELWNSSVSVDARYIRRLCGAPPWTYTPTAPTHRRAWWNRHLANAIRTASPSSRWETCCRHRTSLSSSSTSWPHWPVTTVRRRYSLRWLRTLLLLFYSLFAQDAGHRAVEGGSV